MRVRVVEDDDLIGSLLQVLLDSAGHQAVLTSEDFEDMLQPEPWIGVDAVVCDLALNSTVSGVDILTYVRATHPGIRRIVLTAIGEDGAMMRAGREVADVYLDKPVGVEKILAALG